MNTGEIIQSNETCPIPTIETRGSGWRKLLPTGVIAGALLLGACDSDAKKVSDNLSTAADQFEINRRIVFINGVTDSNPLVIEGLCSIEADAADSQLEVTCKIGKDKYKKHFLGLSDNMSYVVEQLDAADADEYRHRVIFKPESIIPNIDLETSGEEEPDEK